MADINFNCPACGETLTASPPTRRGENIDCPACNNRITIPRGFSLKPLMMFLFLLVLVCIVVSRYLPSGDAEPDEVATDAAQEAEPDKPKEIPRESPAPNAQVTEDPMASIFIGMNLDDVQQRMGRPDYTYGKGDTEYLKYGEWELAFMKGKLSEKIKRASR